MFFSTSLKTPDIAETVRWVDTTIACAKDLRKECEIYDFSLEGSYKDADDLKESYEVYRNNRPSEWQNSSKSF